MKFLRRLFGFFAFFLAFGVPAQTAETDDSADPPAPPPAILPENLPLSQAVYEMLLAEIALQRGNVDMAVRFYSDLAGRTHDARIMKRAVEVAGVAQRFDLAQYIARSWLDDDPASAQALKMLVGVLIMSNRLAELPPYLIRVLEEDKAMLADNLLSLNRTFVRSPDRAAVFRMIEAVCRPFFNLAEAHYAVALAANAAGMAERAQQEARLALDLRPDWEMAAFLMVQMLARDSRDEGIDFAETFLGRHPDAEQLRLLLARLLIGERRYTDARTQFDRLAKRSPDDPEIVYPVAMLALQADDRALAETQLEHYVTLDKAVERNSAYYYLGQIAEDDKRIEKAMSHYAQVTSGQHYLPAKMRMARLLFMQKKYDEGRGLLRNVKTEKPEERIQLQIAEATLLREAGRIREAFDFIEKQLVEHPESAELMYETALLAERMNNLPLMETRLRRVIQLRPDNALAYNALGYAYADRNERLPEARQLIEKALSLSPDDAAILDSMGWLLFRLGALPEALSYLERSYGKQEDPEIAAHLGEVLWAMGRQEEARHLLSEARKKFPSSTVLSETARRLAP